MGKYSESGYTKKSRIAFMMIITLIVQLLIPTQGSFAKAVSPVVEIKLGEMTVEVTDISIKEGDKNSKEVGETEENPIEARVRYNIFYYMNLKNSSGADVTTSSAIQLKIPQEFVVKATTIPINVDADGTSVHIADCYVKADGSAQIRFLESIKDYDDINDMYFSIGCAINEEVIDSQGERPVEFIMEEIKARTTLYFKPYEEPSVIPVPAVIEKAPEGDSSDETKIYWKITVKEAGTQELAGTEIVDRLDTENLEFLGMRDVNKKVIDPSTNPPIYTYDADTGELRYTLPSTLEASNLPYTVYVETRLTDNVFETTKNEETVTISNTAYLEDVTLAEPKIISNQATESTDVKVEWIHKTGQESTVDGNTVINWTVIVNKNNRDIKNAFILDEIPEGLKLVEDTVKIQEVTDSNTLSDLTGPVIEGALDGSNYFYEKVGKGSSRFDGKTDIIGRLKYKFPNDANNTSYKLTYTTKVVQDNIHDSNKEVTFTNYAGLGWGGNTYKYFDYGRVSIATNMLAKSGNYSKRTHRIKWTVTVNTNKINMTEAIMTDDIEFESAQLKQKLVPGTVQLDGKPLTQGVSYTNGILTCDLGNIGVTTHKLTFETEVTNPEHYATNHGDVSYSNKAQLNGQKDGTTTLPTSKAEATVNVGSEVIKKSGKGYDYITREVTWEIVINQNRMPITTAIVEDIIPEGQQYVPNSFKLFKYDEASNTSKPDSYENVGSLTTPSETDSPQKLNYTFNTEINEQYTLEFKTKLTEDYASALFAGTESNKMKYVKNNAILSVGAIPVPGQAVEGSQEIKNAVITKEGRQIGGVDGPILWEVIVNPNQIGLTGAMIVDELESGLELDIQSIVLNEINIDKHGVQTLGDEVPLVIKDSVVYDYTENKLAFKLPSPTNKCYKLSFKTDVDAKNGASFDNTVMFKGKGVRVGESAQKKQVKVQVTSSGGVASKRPGIINILKKDATDPTNKKPLEGAIFEVIDNLGIVIASATTDEEGKAKFTKLKLGVEYTIREKEAPAGYAKNDIEEKVIFDVSNKEKTVTFENVAVSRMLKFKKVSDTNKPIQGAVFSLYAQTDTTFGAVLATAESTDQGEVVFNNITFGNYQLKETATPMGYIPSTQVYEVVVEKNGTVTLSKKGDFAKQPITEITNNIIKGSIEFKKVGEELQPLEHAEFGLFEAPYVQGTNPIQKEESNVEGIVLFEDVPYGAYVIKETKAPIKHKLNDAEFKVNITSTAKVVLGDVKNELKDDCRIEINKVDEKGNPLEGAEFTLFDATNNVVAKSESKLDGIALFEKVKYGTYTVKETKAPKYYILSDEVKKIVIDSDEAHEITIENTRKQDGRLRITKVNNQQHPLEGAEFTLFDLEGNSIQVASSDKQGIALFENISHGKYTLKETKAPKGYKVNEEVEEVEIISDEEITFTIINKKKSTNNGDSDGSNGGGGNGNQEENDPPSREEESNPPSQGEESDLLSQGEESDLQGEDDTALLEKEDGKESVIQDQTEKGMPKNSNEQEGKDQDRSGKNKVFDGEKLPQTGNTIDIKVLILAGFLLILMGIGYTVKIKSKKHE